MLAVLAVIAVVVSVGVMVGWREMVVVMEMEALLFLLVNYHLRLAVWPCWLLYPVVVGVGVMVGWREVVVVLMEVGAMLFFLVRFVFVGCNELFRA